MLIVLACVSAGVLGYFIWLFLAPPESASPFKEVISTDVQAGLVKEADFSKLQPYAVLPITPSNVGRANPFIPLPVMNPDENEQGNANENANVPQNANRG